MMRWRKKERWRSTRTRRTSCSEYAISRPFCFCFVVCSLLFIVLASPVREKKKNAAIGPSGGVLGGVGAGRIVVATSGIDRDPSLVVRPIVQLNHGMCLLWIGLDIDLLHITDHSCIIQEEARTFLLE